MSLTLLISFLTNILGYFIPWVYSTLYKKFWDELFAFLFLLIQHKLHIKRHVQQFFYGYMYICCHGNMSTKTLPSNDTEEYTYTFFFYK